LAGLAVVAVVLLAFGLAQAASSGPASGGNTLTITGTAFGNGSDITNVTLCGIVAVIQSQMANSVAVVTGRADDGGTGDIKVYSASRGVTTFTNGYTYNPPGAIFGPLMGWLSVSSLPAARADLAAASVNGKIYAIGGKVGTYYQSTVYVYDPSQPTQGWLSVSNLPAARYGLATASLNGKIYAIGGYDGSSYQSTVYVYDPAQTSLGWLSVSNLPNARAGLAAASVNGKIYAIGGGSGSGFQSTVYVYDPSQPTQGWLSVSNLPAARYGLATASLNGKIYAIGGGSNVVSIQSTVYVYDPSQPTQGWLSMSNLPAVRRYLVAASVNGKIYAIGGDDGFVSQSTVYVYDPAQPTQGWLSVSNLPSVCTELAVASVNNKIYAIGGYNGVSGYSYQSVVYEGSVAPDVMPSSGPLTGGNTVTINGYNLGNGDLTGVTLCSIPATILADHSPTQVVVSAGPAAIPVTGDVAVYSTSYGVTVKSNAYTYLLLPTITTMPAFDGTHLQLSWPTNCLGWELQAQTNPPGAGLGTNWFPVADSTNNTQMSLPIDPNNPSVFYRLHQQ
jgi:N-acetylneuraminic acid mutarotase